MAIVEPGHRFSKRFDHFRLLDHSRGGSKSTFADLNVTPLVDMFVILVLFLIANFSATGEVLAMSNDVQLPSAANTDELIAAPVVIISKDEVLVSGQSIGRVEDLAREDYLSIPVLEEKLREVRKQFENLHAAANDTGAFKGDVNIQGDKSAKFSIVKRVMFSCASAGFTNISFATLAAGSSDKETEPKPPAGT